jgi:ferric-dicitrate binding protein FerR (iron transport regulator)
MKSKVILAMLSVALLVYAPVVEQAVATTSMLGQVMVKGNAKINGIATLSGGMVFSGDEVGTGKNTVAELLLNGGSKVLLPQTSAVVLNNDAAQVIVNLKQGSLAVLSKTSSPAFIDANGARIKPAADAAIVMEVAVLGNSLKVLVRRGSASVETADKTLEVGEGKELDATVAPPSPQGPGPHMAGRNRLATWVFVGAVAAGLTGLVLGIIAITRDNPANCTVVSPSGAGSIQCP